jgi:hypothetical protein
MTMLAAVVLVRADDNCPSHGAGQRFLLSSALAPVSQKLCLAFVG